MKRILKYALKMEHWQKLGLPKYSEILSAHVQYGLVCLWVLADEEEIHKTLEVREIFMIGTGDIVKDIEKKKFHGTVLLKEGTLVLHVFEGLN